MESGAISTACSAIINKLYRAASITVTDCGGAVGCPGRAEDQQDCLGARAERRGDCRHLHRHPVVDIIEVLAGYHSRPRRVLEMIGIGAEPWAGQ